MSESHRHVPVGTERQARLVHYQRPADGHHPYICAARGQSWILKMR